MSRSLSQDLNDPNLFKEHKPGDYEYTSNASGKSASGSLTLDADVERDAKAQVLAGGESRRGKDHEWGPDDGGHLIGARFGGSSGEENLTAQDRNLNRSDYKKLEEKWAKYLDQSKGNKVFVNIETDDPDRPNAYMGYAIYEDKYGRRDYETFYYMNESRSTKAGIEAESEMWEREYEAEHGNPYYEDCTWDNACLDGYNNEYMGDWREEVGYDDEPYVPFGGVSSSNENDYSASM